jgi:ribosomal protein L36
MKIDPSTLKSLNANAKHIVRNGDLRIWLESDGNVYLHKGSAKTLIGRGTHVRAEVPVGAEISASVKAHVRDVYQEPKKPSGEVFTNFDKVPGESALAQAIKAEVRKLAARRRSAAIARAKDDIENLRRNELVVKKEKAPVDRSDPEPNEDGTAQPRETEPPADVVKEEAAA